MCLAYFNVPLLHVICAEYVRHKKISSFKNQSRKDVAKNKAEKKKE
jgi:hypothetical protein